MNDTALLHVGAETDCNLIKITTKDGAGPYRGSIADGDLAGQNHVGSHVGIDCNLRKPLTQRYYLPLSSVVPLHAIR